jgi:hypothetical protein
MQQMEETNNRRIRVVKSIYLAGPMRGIPEFNFPAFHAAREMLRAQGHTVFCPAENDIRRHGKDISKDNPTGSVDMAVAEHAFDLGQAIHEDLTFIAVGGCTTIAFLPGWEFSSGASGPEFALAKFLKREFMYL